MARVARDAAAVPSRPEVDFEALYDRHPEYVARRRAGSFEQAQIDVEVRLFKLPHLLSLLPGHRSLRSVLEIGCATGELIAAVPLERGGRKVGIDISPANIEVARERFPAIEFRCGDARAVKTERFDAVILSDVLEHVPDDAGLLRDAAALADTVLINLPLEDNWLNAWRAYGPSDVSGHLRKYALADGLRLPERAGLQVVAHAQVWIHETPAEEARRAVRRLHLGADFSGIWPARVVRRSVFALARALPSVGRRVFASNLFVAARSVETPSVARAHPR